MIFVTVGTHEAPFPRLIRALDLLPREQPLVVQHGFSKPGPAWATCVDFLPFESLVENVRRSSVTITHGGVGSIMVALANGKRPLVVPRLRSLSEHVDDHQLELARRLGEVGLVTVVEDASRLPSAIAEDLSTVSTVPAASRQLIEDLQGYLAQQIDRRSRASLPAIG